MNNLKANKIFDLVHHHLSFLEQIFSLTNLLKEKTNNNDIENIAYYSDNRQRLITIVGYFQNQIDKYSLHALNNKETHQLLKLWEKDKASLVDKTLALDKEIIENLRKQQKQTAENIKAIFQKKDRFKGYNLSDVRR